MTNEAVDNIVNWDVYGDVYHAVNGAVALPMARALYRDVYWTINRIVVGAMAQALYEDAPHPGLELYSKWVA